jgi:phosphatidylserine/phosphatidylglycerophosphate/cardiolipin synthase-like enzyme
MSDLELISPEPAAPRRRFKKRWVLWGACALWPLTGLWHSFKPMPSGTDIATEFVTPDEVRFLHDLSFNDGRGARHHEQQIFDEIFRIIDSAESFIVADFFLMNDLMGAADTPLRPLSSELVQRLIARKRARPELQVLLITDPINEVYGGVHSKLLEQLRAAGIDAVVCNLEQLRDSNPLYSSLWRIFGQWWGNAVGKGSMPNPFDTEPARLTVRSWLALLNFKANHRKLIAADRENGQLAGLITSANPHDASSAHANVALAFTSRTVVKAMVDSEMSLAGRSGWRGHVYVSAPDVSPLPGTAPQARMALLTEQSIRDHLLGAIARTRGGDAIQIATFYLADRKLIAALLEAAARNVKVRLILDPNRDAFGREKDGVPNRPVANELVNASGERIQVRWYRTHGEQFHTKLALLRHGQELTVSLGSANLTRRNLGNYNLEANIALELPAADPVAAEMLGYFERLWSNDDAAGVEFTAPFGAYRDTDAKRYWRYRFMEATGLSTF